MSLVADDIELCVTCPRCGRVNQKAFKTDSIIKCNKCGYSYYTLINDGVTISMAASKLDVTSRKTILYYAREIMKHD